MPLVSVVMPVYNGAEYLDAAVRSVLDQTIRDLELVVVDDGSSDDSLHILDRLADEDRRIRVVPLGTNHGHDTASNRAVGLAEGELIARHDQDDLLMLDWLDNAARFLGAHDDIGLLGGAYRAFEGDETAELRRPPQRHTEIRASLLFKNVICHPGVVVRGALRETGEFEYRNFAGPQDYDLWVRLLRVTRGANLPELAVMYRRHTTTMSASFESDMPSEVERISNRQIEELLGADTPGLDGLRAIRRLWRANQLSPGDLSYVPMMDATFEKMAVQPDIDRAEIGVVRDEWMQRVMSGSFRMAGRPPFRLMRAEPRAAGRWVTGGISRSATRRLATFPGESATPGSGVRDVVSRVPASLRSRTGRLARRTVLRDGTLETMWVRHEMNHTIREFLEAAEPERSHAAELGGDFWSDLPWASHVRLCPPELDLAVPPHDFEGWDSYDVVICDQMLQRVPDPVEGLRTLVRLARPGGTVVVSTPFLIKIDPCPGDLWRFAPEALTLLMQHVGLHDIEVDGWGNRSCVRANLRRWVPRRPWHSLRNEPECPAVVWGRGIREPIPGSA